MSFVTTSIFLLTLIASTVAHWDPAYFRNSYDGFNERKTWMSEIPGHVRLSEMAIPGTHDSASFGGYENDILFTQCLNIDDQLRFGIRFFDIRIRHFENFFPLHHGVFYLHQDFDNFLGAVHSFLRQNPSETVLFRLREEHTEANNCRNILGTLDDYLKKWNSYLNTSNRDITLGEARGRFIILYDNNEFRDRGISYGSSNIQDEFHLGTNWDLYHKWERIRSQIDNAKDGDPNTFYLNYLSGSGGSFPYFVASGHSSPGTGDPRLATGLTTPGWQNSYPDFPRVNCFIGICTIAFEGTNILARDRIRGLSNNRQRRTVGIIIADFPGNELIHEVIRNNWILK